MLNILLELYWTFFKIGVFTFGGGYVMIPLLEAEVIGRLRWLTATEFIDIIAVAEMTPGPVAINSATYVGFKLAGIPGALLATLGVVTPSLVILLLISRWLMKLLQNPRAEHLLSGLRPALIALILLAAFSLGDSALVDLPTIAIGVLMLAAAVLRKTNPLYLIAAGAVLGLIFYPY
jgi:chromate transporter